MGSFYPSNLDSNQLVRLQLFSILIRTNPMIELSNLNAELVDVTADELESVHGGDSLGALIGGVSGFGAAGVLSGGDPIKAVRGGTEGASAGNLVPVAANPAIGAPTAAFLGTAVGIVEAFSPSALSFAPEQFSSSRLFLR
jgi:hypothetical protein